MHLKTIANQITLKRLALCWALFLIHGIWLPLLLIFMCFHTFLLIFLFNSSVLLSPFLHVIEARMKRVI